MTQIYFNDTEAGNLSAYSGTDLSGVGAVAASSSAPKNGTYGVSASVNNTGSSSDRGDVYATFTSNANLITYLNFWFQFNSHANTGFGTAISKGIARIGNDGATGANLDATGRGFSLVTTGTVNQIIGSYRKRDGSGDLTFGSTITFSTGTWYAIRMCLDQSGANPVLTWWSSTDGLNYTQQGTVTDSLTGTGGTASTINKVTLGICHNGQFEGINAVVYLDDVEVRDDVYVPPPQTITASPVTPKQAVGNVRQVFQSTPILPASDISRGNWTTETGGTTGLYQSLDDNPANDADYIISGVAPHIDIAEIKFATATDPAVDYGHYVTYRYGKTYQNGRRVDQTIYLMCGSTVIAQWTHTDVSTIINEVTQNLTDAQAAAITDYTDLRLRFVASSY